MKAVVLLSGGLDSSVLLASVVAKYGAENVHALSIYYGQKHSKETDAAEAIANYYGVHEQYTDLKPIFAFDKTCTLLQQNKEEIPTGSYDKQLEQAEIVSTYVPFRNGLFLAFATSYAYQVGANEVYYGAHSDDAAGNAYPDCTSPFIRSMQDAISFGTGVKVQLIAPFWDKTKADIVAEGLKLNVPFEKTWSCYEGTEIPCCKCGTCIDRIKAFELNGTTDPLLPY